LIAAVVLAAGSSTRLGRPKQLLLLAGRPVLEHVLEAALASRVEQVAVVLGAYRDLIMPSIHPNDRITLVANPDHARGQSTSLRAGLLALGPEVEAAVVLLGDQPGVGPAAVEAIISAWRDGAGRIVRASYSGVPGHPTLCERSVWPALVRIEGDVGVRAALEEHPDWESVVELGGSPPPDIDTEQDYERVRAIFEPS
jgi:molybdenum cofactor cytidylyltransferase